MAYLPRKLLRISDGNTISKEIEERLYPGGLSRAGFLAKGEKFEDVVAADTQEIKKFCLSHEEIAQKLTNVIEGGLRIKGEGYGTTPWVDHKVTVEGEKYTVSEIQFRGWQDNPFKDIPVTFASYPSKDFTIINEDKNQKIRISGMTPYLIGNVHFFEGHTSYRVEPKELIEVLNLEKSCEKKKLK